MAEIFVMTETELLGYIIANPEYLTDSYFRVFGKAIEARAALLAANPLAVAATLSELDALRTRLQEVEADARRLDWLSRQSVTVRTPMRYGSKARFAGVPDIEEESWPLRAAIDAAIPQGASEAPSTTGSAG